VPDEESKLQVHACYALAGHPRPPGPQMWRRRHDGNSQLRAACSAAAQPQDVTAAPLPAHCAAKTHVPTFKHVTQGCNCGSLIAMLLRSGRRASHEYNPPSHEPP
jgi:hypothetical protein